MSEPTTTPVTIKPGTSPFRRAIVVDETIALEAGAVAALIHGLVAELYIGSPPDDLIDIRGQTYVRLTTENIAERLGLSIGQVRHYRGRLKEYGLLRKRWIDPITEEVFEWHGLAGVEAVNG